MFVRMKSIPNHWVHSNFCFGNKVHGGVRDRSQFCWQCARWWQTQKKPAMFRDQHLVILFDVSLFQEHPTSSLALIHRRTALLRLGRCGRATPQLIRQCCAVGKKQGIARLDLWDWTVQSQRAHKPWAWKAFGAPLEGSLNLWCHWCLRSKVLSKHTEWLRTNPLIASWKNDPP